MARPRTTTRGAGGPPWALHRQNVAAHELRDLEAESDAASLSAVVVRGARGTRIDAVPLITAKAKRGGHHWPARANTEVPCPIEAPKDSESNFPEPMVTRRGLTCRVQAI